MKFLHLTDLHYSPEQDGYSSRNLRKTLPKYIKDNKLKADELFLSGDYRHALLCKKESADIVKLSVEFIRTIAESAGIYDVKHIHLVPGNHDRDRSIANRKLKQIQTKYSPNSGVIESENLNLLMDEFDFFYQVCHELYGKNNPWEGKPLHTYVVSKTEIILYVNTAIMHNQDQDRGSLIIGIDKLARLFEEIQEKYPKLPIIVLAHHAPEYFREDERKVVEQLFRTYPVKLYLCGDAHKVWWRISDNHLEITMGCLKDGDSVTASFLYADTNNLMFTAYRWEVTFGADSGWGPYTQFNNSLQEKIPSKKKVVFLPK